MGVVIIPFDWEQLPDSQKIAIVPICIADVDRHGNEIARTWFEEGVAPIQDRLRTIAKFKLGDVHRVSELAELTVHKLWAKHGANVGTYPARRVLVRAMWEARDLAAGNSQWRIKHTVPLVMGALENDLYQNGLPDRTNYEQVYERGLLVKLIEQRIEEDKRDDIRLVFSLLRQGYTWDEVALKLQDPKPEALKKRFWRWIRQRIAKDSSR